MKRVIMAAFSRSAQGALVAAFLAATALHAAPKKSKDAQKPAAKPAAGAPATPTPGNPEGSPAAQVQPSQPATAPADDLYEGPASSRPKPATPRPAAADGKIEAPLSAGPRFADAWPSEYRKAESDLALSATGVGRAQAMAEYVRGLHADKKGDADVALEAWKRAASLDPENAEIAVKVAFELAKRNEPGEAIRILKDSIAAAPKEPRTHIYLAQIYARHLNKPDLAIAAAQKAIEVAPENFQAWVAAYDLLQQNGDKKKATDLLDRAIKSPAKDAEFWLRLGRHLQKIFLDKDATPSPDELRQMESVFRKASDLKPDSASVLTQAGDFFVLARQNKDALSFYERAMKLAQVPSDEPTRNLPEKYADLLIKEGRTADALVVLEKLAASANQSLRSDLYERLGELYEEAGQVDKAVEHFRQTLVLDTVEPRNHHRLADVQLRAKRYDDAIQTMEAARKKFKNDPGATFGLARVLGFAKRYKEALEVFDSAADELRGRNEGALTAMFLEEWAFAAERAGNLDKATELLKKCMADYPDDPRAYNDLGYLWVERGMNLEEAGEMIKKAVEMNPKQPAYLDSLGWYYYKVGKFEDARRELLGALSLLKEDDATILDHIADTYEKLGNIKEAVQYWERALKLEPDAPEKIREKLEAGKKKLGT